MKKCNCVIKKLICLSSSLAIILSGCFLCANSALVAKAASQIEYVDEGYADYIANLENIISDHDVIALVYMTDSMAIMAEPSYYADSVIEIGIGSSVRITDVHVVTEDEVDGIWYEVKTVQKGKEYTGFVLGDNLAIADDAFNDCKSALESEVYPYSLFSISLFSLSPADDAEIAQFPASYQSALTALKQAHPSWIFVPFNTGLDWNTVIANEIGGSKSLVYKSLNDFEKEGVFGTNWYYASEDILKYYMDPRNWLTEKSIFQFELLSSQGNYYTEAALDSFLANTFMASANGYAPETQSTFANIFYRVGTENGVSPIHLASRVIQEQGKDGGSSLISGNYPGFEGLYNYFNVNASGSTNTEVIVNGLTYARNNTWINAEASIRGGSATISMNYIGRGQDTTYLQKFNVTNTSTYNHQYMQNISAPSSEAITTYNMYKNAGQIDSGFVFRIPVFNNMPAAACARPTCTTNVVLELPSGYDSKVYIDGVEKTGVSRNGQYIINVGNSSARNALVYKYNSSGTPVGMYVWTIQYKNGNYYETAQSALTDMLSYHGFSIRMGENPGMRFKSGITQSARNSLTSTGVNGYSLVEYGTLIMNSNYTSSLPFVYGGAKVVKTVAYGSGVDNIFAVTDGRYQFTSVLTEIPASQYPVNLAFRSYAILQKDGEYSIVYGAPQTRSIYSLANQYISSNIYANGSAEYNYLQSILAQQ